MLKHTLAKVLVPFVIMSSAFAVNANEYTITFDEDFVVSPYQDGNGNTSTIIDNEYVGTGLYDGIDVTFWAQHSSQGDGSGVDLNDATTFSNNNADGFLTLFNSEYTGTTADSDLQFVDEDKGNLGIIHEVDVDGNGACAGNSCTNPDDRYVFTGTSEPNGGFIFIEFSEAVNLHSIDLADMESNANQQGSFAFYNAAGNLVPNAGDNWTDMIAAGENTYSTQSLAFAQNITTMVIRMQGSGGFKNLSFSKVPEPTTLAIFGLGLIALVARRRKA